MKIKFAPLLVLAGGFFAGILRAAEPTPPPAPAAAATPSRSSASPSTSKAAASTSDAPAATPGLKSSPPGLQGMAREFDHQSKDVLAKRKALLDRLNSAKTEDEKQRIIAELRLQQQARIDAQRERARLIREQMLNNRRGEPAAAATPGR